MHLSSPIHRAVFLGLKLARHNVSEMQAQQHFYCSPNQRASRVGKLYRVMNPLLPDAVRSDSPLEQLGGEN